MTDLKIQIGEYIRENRRKQGVTQENLAEMRGISTHHISKIECGKTAAKFESILNICSALDISMDYFLYLVDTDKERPRIELQQLKEKAIYEELKMQLNEAVKQAIDAFDYKGHKMK